MKYDSLFLKLSANAQMPIKLDRAGMARAKHISSYFPRHPLAEMA